MTRLVLTAILRPFRRFVDSMERETRAFLRAMVRENLPASTAIAADFTFVNDRLAAHYDLPRVSGSAMQRVTLPKGSPFGGLITQAALMKHTANGTTTSPVLRGVWIMEKLMGQPPPPPPKSVPAVEPDIRGATTCTTNRCAISSCRYCRRWASLPRRSAAAAEVSPDWSHFEP